MSCPTHCPLEPPPAPAPLNACSIRLGPPPESLVVLTMSSRLLPPEREIQATCPSPSASSSTHPEPLGHRIEPHPGLLVEKLFDLRPGAVQTTIRPQLRLLLAVVFTATRLPSAASFVISPPVENTTSGRPVRARPRAPAAREPGTESRWPGGTCPRRLRAER